jgi:hypothetical protein
MKRIIYNLRNQSEEVRRHVLHLFTFIMAIILLFIWLYSLGSSLSSSKQQVKKNNEAKPFSALQGNLIGGYESIVESK